MDINKKFTSAPLELETEIVRRRYTNRRKGRPFAWQIANEFASLKNGYPLMIAGVGGAGKTELPFDIIINDCIMHDKKAFIFSPETGDKYEILEYIIEKVSNGRHLEKPHDYAIDDKELEKIHLWANKHFRICDPTEHWDANFENLEMNMDNLFQAVDYEERRLGGKFDIVLIDTFNDLDIKPDSQEVKNNLSRLLAWTKKKNYLTITTNHVNDLQDIRQKIDGEYVIWTPPAKKEQWSYGQQFAKKGYQMWLVYEEHKYFIDERAMNGDQLAQHSKDSFYTSRKIFVQKSKPKGVGRTGMFELFYDKLKHRYYEIDQLGNKRGILQLKLS
jgi:hypothetical protein